jgi:hypothetical protein
MERRTVGSGVGKAKGEVRVIMSWDITARGITTRGKMARGIRCDEIELRESTNTNKPTQVRLGSSGQEEGTMCSASMQASTLAKDKVSGSKPGGQKVGADTATSGEHKPQTKPNRRQRRVSSEQGNG